MTPLRQRMLEDMSIRNLAENTQLSYVQQVSAFARHFARSPEELGPEQVRAYQSHLVVDRHLAASSIATATAALRFLYRVTLRRDWTPDDIPMPKKPFELPVILSPEEVTLFLASVVNLKHRTPSSAVARAPSAATSSSVMPAGTSASPSTAAGIATARSVSR